ncbi:MAG TPA: DUF4349 domain-containing protein [Thermoanaerobaculia bacterium]|nr:DUF4349 domain-containing protein [Thermoanaerobaculia bacterium]
MRHLSWLVIVGLVLLGCHKDEAEMEEAPPVAARAAAPQAEPAPAAAAEQAAPGTPAAPPPPPAAQSRKLIRTVELELAVKDTVAAARRVQEIAAANGGFVEAMNAQRVESLMHYEMTLRLPAERLDEALTAIKGLAVEIDREQLATEDATSRYVDLQSRLRTLTVTESELRELLAESRERGRKVEDVMAVYRELTEIRGQIEQIQGQLQSIDRLSALSTLHLRLRPDVAAAPIVRGDEWRPLEIVRASARALVKILQFLVNALIIAVIVVLPILLPLWLLLRILQRRKRRGGVEGE